MRFADNPTTEASLRIAADAEKIWTSCTDPGLPVATSDELQEARWDPDGPPPGPGARILGRNRRGSREWHTVSTVVLWEPPHRWSYEVRSSLSETPLSQWWYTIDDHDDGTATVIQRVRLGPGPSGLTMAIERNPTAEEEIVDGRLAHLAASMLANLHTLAATIGADTLPESA